MARKKATEEKSVTVNVTYLWLREEPNGKKIKYLEEGTKLDVLEVSDGWIKTSIGYVMEKYVK